jgi:hypothetical protein
MKSYFSEPMDGFDIMERQFLKELILTVYKRITNPMDKFIVIATFEAGYTQSDVAEILGVSQVAINKKLDKIQTFFNRTGKLSKECINSEKIHKRNVVPCPICGEQDCKHSFTDE